MTKLLALLLLLLAPLAASAQDRPDYAAGQVWEYHNRPQDAGSLLKIQAVEADPLGKPIYHISLIGVTFMGQAGNPVGHLPVSRETLDASVTRLSTSSAEFPDATEGIGIWREAQGGVFTITVAQIMDYVERMIPKPSSN